MPLLTLVRSLFALALLACCVPPASAATGQADARFDALSKRYVEEFGRYAPVSATQLGDHRFDSELDDLSAAGRARTLAWTRGVLAELQAIDRAQLSRSSQVDAAMLDNQLRYSIWAEEKYRDWSWDPLLYTQLAGQSLYGLLARDFAPLADRLRSLAGKAPGATRCDGRAHHRRLPEAAARRIRPPVRAADAACARSCRRMRA